MSIHECSVHSHHASLGADGDGDDTGPHYRRPNLNPSSSGFGCALKETFFPDDPFRGFSNLPPLTRTWRCLQYYLPVLEWAPAYDFQKLRYDLLAGITVASLAIPQGISYAKLANLPPVIGLYSSFVPPLIYAIFGSSKNLSVGTVAAASLLLAAMIGNQAPATQDPTLYLHLFYTAAFFTGVFQLIMGIFRLGILVDFLSRSTIVGFMSGTATIIILQQLKGMLGLQHFTTKTDIVSVMHSIFTQTHQWRWQSVVLGLCFLGFLLFTRYLKNKKPHLFWVSAISPLIVVIIGGAFAYLTHAQTHGIPVVGPLKKGLNPLSVGSLQFSGKYMTVALKAGLVTGFLALAEGIAVGRSLALMKHENIDGNKEMVAFGLMNIVGSLTSCYLTTGPFSKSAVNYNAGCRTAMSNVVMSLCMMLVLLFLAPLFSHTPLVALSSIIIVAMIGLIEYEEAYHLYKLDKFDFCICMAAFIGVVFLSMDIGLMISVGFSIIRSLLYVARPSTYKLGRLDNSFTYEDVRQYPEAERIPGVLILRLGSPIYFANAGYLRERIVRWVEEEIGTSTKVGDDGILQYLILDLSGITSIDKTGVEMLIEVSKILEKTRGIKLVLVDPRSEVASKLVISGLVEKIGNNWVFVTIEEAVCACHYTLREVKYNKGEHTQV